LRLRISEVFQEAHYGIQREYSKENCNGNILFWKRPQEAWKRALLDIIQMKHFSGFGGTDTLVCASINAVLQTFCTDKSVYTTNARFCAPFKLFTASE
jgi:hypothetical protein